MPRYRSIARLALRDGGRRLPANKRMDQSWRGRRLVSGWHGRASTGRFLVTRRATQVMRKALDSAHTSMTDFEALLRSVLTRRIPAREGMRGLAAFATVDFDATPAYVNYRQPCSAEVELTPPSVRDALTAYLAGYMTARELRDWAIFITLSGAFHTPAPPANDEDWYDPLWDALHDLACPEMHGAITPSAVRVKLATMERFIPPLAPGAV